MGDSTVMVGGHGGTLPTGVGATSPTSVLYTFSNIIVDNQHVFDVFAGILADSDVQGLLMKTSEAFECVNVCGDGSISRIET